ncbi:DUF1345 domain-containing protein [Shinella yambaruensis]|uniref:Membrane protein n=1 Tax=Shinella yambaruensis TaxID=415996 RepID=A0ABQ5ZMR3_9HYPH|nr:DUF1345 domain-containing protein [Shinella yambaruensis]MCJ8023956.1 DUF1345 domain-containing protein [Shinella yambaruensis]MCU7978894.1 DUF1345 domain-containing protein [Shinella yambaruensis]GLR51967.1 membrane protein [Shinella yambaruensis]
MKKAPGPRIYGRHLPFYVGIGAAALALALALWLKPDFAIGIAAVAFFLCYLLLTAWRVPRLTAAHLEYYATDTDEPVTVIFAVTFAAVAVSTGSLFVVLNRPAASLGEFVLAFASVALGWLTIHTMAAMHYAHLYWRPGSTETSLDAGRSLDFPGKAAPGAYDFLYFAFVIGMTAQTSDVAITSTAMRKVNLLHAIVSFFFNTVLVAAAVNAAVSLAT